MEILKQITEVSSGLVSPLTAICVVYIAYRQWKTDDLDKKRRITERKISIYKSVAEHLSHIDRTMQVDPDTYRDFRLAFSESQFYFPLEVIEYLSEINSNSHQWLLEYAYLQQNGETESDDLDKNLDALTTASFKLEKTMGSHVMAENV